LVPETHKTPIGKKGRVQSIILAECPNERSHLKYKFYSLTISKNKTGMFIANAGRKGP
jgi:hypothetical protein